MIGNWGKRMSCRTKRDILGSKPLVQDKDFSSLSFLEMTRQLRRRFGFMLLLAVSIFMFTGCYEDITGTVVDADTGEPLEGAIVLVEWTKTKGIPGLTYHEVYEVTIVITDKEGKATLAGLINPLVGINIGLSSVAVYKKGYVGWSNRQIFPSYERRIDFKWQNNYVFKLEKFKPEYSHEKHCSFMQNAISSHMASDKKKIMKDSYRWECLWELYGK